MSGISKLTGFFLASYKRKFNNSENPAYADYWILKYKKFSMTVINSL